MGWYSNYNIIILTIGCTTIFRQTLQRKKKYLYFADLFFGYYDNVIILFNNFHIIVISC